MTPKKTRSIFERNEKVAERFHDNALTCCYVHHDYDKALSELRNAISMREALHGKFHNDTALSYFRMASVLLEAKKEYFEALVYSRREFRISQMLLGASEFSTITSNERWLVERKEFINNALAMEQNAALSKEKADQYCSQLLQSIEFERLGNSHCKAKEWELAITQYNCALALESAAYARNQVDMADLHVKIGDCLVEIQDYEGALMEFENAEYIYKEKFGRSHTTLAIVFSKMALIYLKLRDYDAALAFHSKSYGMYEEFFGREHEICVEVLKDIRLVAVKEIEDLRQQERQKLRNGRKGRGEVYDSPNARNKGTRSSPRHTL